MEKEQTVGLFGAMDRPLVGKGICDECGMVHHVQHEIAHMGELFSTVDGKTYPFPCRNRCDGTVQIRDVSDFQILVEMVEEYERDNRREMGENHNRANGERYCS